jgi:hypothetical protein
MRIRILSRAEVGAGGAEDADGLISIRGAADGNEPDLPAKDRWKGQRKILLPGTGANLPVDWVHARGNRLDEHLIRVHYRLRRIEFELQRFRATIFIKSNGFHHLFLWLSRMPQQDSKPGVR